MQHILDQHERLEENGPGVCCIQKNMTIHRFLDRWQGYMIQIAQSKLYDVILLYENLI